MRFEDPAAREGYVQEVREAIDAAYERLPERDLLSLEQWLIDLEGWRIGDTPLPPEAWSNLLS